VPWRFRNTLPMILDSVVFSLIENLLFEKQSSR